jgi:O-antigen/teichoic acid export membrane protein
VPLSIILRSVSKRSRKNDAPLTTSQQIARALAALWVSRVLAVALNLLLVPLLFRRLAPDELGVWLLMGQVGGLVVLLDFGVTNVLTRRIAIASGASGDPTPPSADLVASARPLYRAMALLVFTVLLLGGWRLMAGLGLDEAATLRARLGWTLLSAANAYALFRGLWTAAATGMGHVAAVSMLGTGVSVGVMALQGGALLLGGGVGTLAALALGGSLLQGAALLRWLRHREPRLMACPGRPSRTALRGLLKASSRYWLTELGAIALLRTDQIFIAGFQQPSQIPAYFAAYSVVYNMALVSMAVAEAASVFVSRLWQEHEPGAVHVLILRSLRIGLALMLCGAGMMSVIGDNVIAVWIGPGHFVGRPVLLAFCAMLTLFVQQSLLLGFSRATENEVYAPCFLAAGLLNLGITWLLIGPLGLLGVALGTLIAQALTTSWFVPVSALRRLQISGRTYMAEVLCPTLLLGACTAAATLLGASGVAGPLRRMAAGGTAGVAAALLGGWFLVLDAEMRRRIRSEAAAAVQTLRPAAHHGAASGRQPSAPSKTARSERP